MSAFDAINFDVVIIGAGAAGLMCAITAGQRGKRVIVLDHANKVGKKILMSGGGRCNFTNLYTEPGNYLSHNPHFCKSALSQYTQWDFIALVDQHQIHYHEKKAGQLFCDNKSQDILNLLLSECKKAGVIIETHSQITAIKHTKGYQVEVEHAKTSQQTSYGCQSLVIATGGLSIPTMGATNFGYQVAQQFELHTYEPIPALVPFTFSDNHKSLFSSLSGLSVPVAITTVDGTHFSENVLFTHRGLSGPAVLQASSYWKKGEHIEIDLLPAINAADWLLEQKQQTPKQQLKTTLTQKLPSRFAELWLEFYFASEANCALNQMPQKKLNHIGQQLNRWQLKPSGTEGYRTAEVTLGGVDTNELSSKTMECKKWPGLYFIGEIVDVTGQLGGFNFQWAWSSGYVAGMHV